MLLRDRVEALQRVGAEEEVDLADRQQDAVVGVRAAGHDGHVEAVFAIGAVGERLEEAALLAFGEPVGAEGDLVEGLRGLGVDRAARSHAVEPGSENGDALRKVPADGMVAPRFSSDTTIKHDREKSPNPAVQDDARPRPVFG